MTTPREVFLALIGSIGAGRFDEMSPRCAEDAVVELPHAAPRPERVTGRAALHARFAAIGGVRLTPCDVVVHETTDPEVVVAEFGYLIGTDPEPAANLLVLRVRDGLVTRSRDYHDHLRLTAARGGLGRLPELYEQAPPRELSPARERGPLAAEGTPRGVFERLVHGVSDRRWADLPDLYAPETLVTHPFLPGAKVLRSRADLREHFTAAANPGVDLEAVDLVVHQGTDPELLVGEFAYQGEYGGRPVRIANVFVLRVRDGLIVESRDYGDHLGVAGDTGTIPQLAARLAGQALPG